MEARIKIFWAGLLVFLFILQPVLVSAGIPEAVTYLQGQVDDAWVTMALVAAGQSDIPTGHLKSVSGNLATDYAKTILAVASVGENPATFGNIDYVAKLKTYYTDNQMGSNVLLNDDMWSILALASVGEANSAESLAAKNFLLSNQNTDGGFSYSVGAGSDTNDTAAAIMALIEAGVNAQSQIILSALAYLQSAQNNDGGIGYQVGNDSDSGSDSWAISALYKAGINPTGWDKNGHNPISHLESLQASDGGFWWVAEGTSEWNNKAMTPYAIIALKGKTYPVGYYQNNRPTDGTYHLRIEGQNNTICDTQITGDTALSLIENAASVCSYTYLITQESYGLYLRSINDEVALGMSGWLYFVDNISPPVGASDYNLSAGDEVFFYFGEWGWTPTKIEVSAVEIDPGQTIDVTAKYFNGTDWLILPNASIKINNDERTVDASGHLPLTINDNGIYHLYVETDDFIRSEKVTVTVGDTVNQNVSLRVEVDQGGSGNIGGEAIALIVNPVQLDFGKLTPGETANQTVTLTNGGTVSLNVGAEVSGDSVFIAGLKINNDSYSNYSENLGPTERKNADISLTVPGSYLASGIRNGELIFWATAD